MSSAKEVIIVVSNKTTNEFYNSRSYPTDDKDGNGKVELYKTPVYKVYIQGKNSKDEVISKVWKAMRFMPFYNDPGNAYPQYKGRGFITAGLSVFPRKAVSLFDQHYGTHNTPSPYTGAIQIKGNFLIHAGPQSITDGTWGGAGCVEIIGNFSNFKNDIKELSGLIHFSIDQSIAELVKQRKLFVEVEYAVKPNLTPAGEK